MKILAPELVGMKYVTVFGVHDLRGGKDSEYQRLFSQLYQQEKGLSVHFMLREKIFSI
jgi:hypothetical protein